MNEHPQIFKMPVEEMNVLVTEMCDAAREQGISLGRAGQDRCRQIISRCLKAVTKEGKTWINAASTLEGRLRIYGWDMERKQWVRGAPGVTKANEPKVRKSKTPRGTKVDEAFDEEKEIKKRCAAYMKAYDNFGGNPGDQQQAEQLVRAEVAVERLQREMQSSSSGRDAEAYGKAIKLHSDVAKNCRDQLGITRKRRKEQEGEQARGTMDELTFMVDAWNKGPGKAIQGKWLIQELAMDLRKMDRTLPDGEPEMTPELFHFVHHVGVERAKEMIPDPYAPDFSGEEEEALFAQYEELIEHYEPI